MISADVEAHVKQQDKKELFQEVPARHEVQCKNGT